MVGRFSHSYDVLTFDFVGCGVSKGEFVTLGLNEAEDLKAIIQHMYTEHGYRDVYLWGRSMGAVSILHLLHGFKRLKRERRRNELRIERYEKARLKSADPKSIISNKVKQLRGKNGAIDEQLVLDEAIRAVVLDAPFTCAYKMLGKIIRNQANTSSFTTYIALQYLKRSVRSNIGRDIITENKPESLVKELTTPAAFLLGEHDELVSVDDFMSMFNEYGAEYKRFRLMVNTDHAASREEEDIDAGFRFLQDMHEMHVERKGGVKKDKKVTELLEDSLLNE